MTLVSRRTEITVETREVLVVRASGAGARPLCDACGGPTRARAASHAPNRALAWRLCAALRAWLLPARADRRGRARNSDPA